MTKLYNIPKNSLIKLKEELQVPPGAPKLYKDEIIKFYHLDGMYSYCKTLQNELCHLAANADVEYVGKFED